MQQGGQVKPEKTDFILFVELREHSVGPGPPAAGQVTPVCDNLTSATQLAVRCKVDPLS